MKQEYVEIVVTHVRVQLILVNLFFLCIRSRLRRGLFGLDRLFGSLLLTTLELANDVKSIDIKGENNTNETHVFETISPVTGSLCKPERSSAIFLRNRREVFERDNEDGDERRRMAGKSLRIRL